MIYKEHPKYAPSKIKLVDHVNLYRIYPGIYAVAVIHDFIRSRIFLRCQEFYESSSSDIHRKPFTWDQYIEFYKKKTGNKRFTYHSDFVGYNVPSNIIKQCYQDIPDPNVFDEIFGDINQSIQINQKGRYYIIGIDGVESDDKYLIHHEFAHGLYHVNKPYKKRVDTLIRSIPIDIRDKFNEKLTRLGYSESVFDDEMQAYMSTELVWGMNRIPGVVEHSKRFEENFKKYVGLINPERIEVTYGNLS